MGSLQTMTISLPLRVSFQLILFLVFSTMAFSQSGKCRSVSVERSASCANVYIQAESVTSRRLFGKVDWPGEGSVVLEVFKIDRIGKNEDLSSATSGMEPFIVLETNERGEFCHSGLDDGLYIVKFGIDGGGWNCTWVKVRIARTAAERKIEVGLEIGT